MRFINTTKFCLDEDTAVCIGKFEGLHLGHQSLIEEARKSGFKIVLLALSMNSRDNLFLLDEKRMIAQRLGIDIMIEYPFTDDIKNMTPDEFITEILMKKCHCKCVVVGEDFHFGYQRTGDCRYLEQKGAQDGFQVRVIPRLTHHNKIISSSQIRKELMNGSCDMAKELLGFPFFFSGEVVYGNQIGRTLNMPTANLVISDGKIIVPNGVYASITQIDDTRYKGVTNVGIKPTIPGVNVANVETNIFDFNQNIYGKKIIVYLYRFTRPEKKFANLDELKENMLNDSIQAKEALSHITL